MKTFVFVVAVEATRTYHVEAKTRKEALKKIMADDFSHETDYSLGNFHDENQIQEEEILKE